MLAKLRFVSALSALLILCGLSMTESSPAVRPTAAQDESKATDDEFELEADNESDYEPEAVNVASSAAGAVAIASSTLGSNWPAGSVINGERAGDGWQEGTGGWNDANTSFPDSLEIRFNRPKTINRIDIYTLQDAYQSSQPPTADTKFSLYGIVDFYFQYRDQATGDWVTLGGRNGNDNVWNQFFFPEVVTERIRVIVTNALQGYTRIVEIEAWGGGDANKSGPPARYGPCGLIRNTKDPCEMLTTLHQAMREYAPAPGEDVTRHVFKDPTPQDPSPDNTKANWYGGLESRRDWYFERMQDRDTPLEHQYGSQNYAPMTHAITLFDATDLRPQAVKLDWWKTYLGCQLGYSCVRRTAAGAVDDDPEMLKYWNGAELFSNTYDADVVTSVLAVRYRAQVAIDRNQANDDVWTLYNLSREYLRRAWAFYALASGNKPAGKRFNRNKPAGEPCATRYSGPFLSMAGMRSTDTHDCNAYDARGPMFARALGMDARMASLDKPLNKIWDRIQTRPVCAGCENAYSLTPSIQTFLRNFITTGGHGSADAVPPVDVLFNLLKQIRTAVPYHFFAWVSADGARQLRLTVMEESVNRNTSPVLALKFDYRPHSSSIGQNIAQGIYPYAGQPYFTTDPHLWSTQNFEEHRGPYCEPKDYRPFRVGVALGAAKFNSNTEVKGVSDKLGLDFSNRGGTCANERVKTCPGCTTYAARPIVETMRVPNINQVSPTDDGVTWKLLYHIVMKPNAAPCKTVPVGNQLVTQCS